MVRLWHLPRLHAEYMASTGVCSHTGAGGTTAKQRMVNAGYGGGATVWGTENIYVR